MRNCVANLESIMDYCLTWCFLTFVFLEGLESAKIYIINDLSAEANWLNHEEYDPGVTKDTEIYNPSRKCFLEKLWLNDQNEPSVRLCRRLFGSKHGFFKCRASLDRLNKKRHENLSKTNFVGTPQIKKPPNLYTVYHYFAEGKKNNDALLDGSLKAFSRDYFDIRDLGRTDAFASDYLDVDDFKNLVSPYSSDCTYELDENGDVVPSNC